MASTETSAHESVDGNPGSARQAEQLDTAVKQLLADHSVVKQHSESERERLKYDKLILQEELNEMKSRAEKWEEQGQKLSAKLVNYSSTQEKLTGLREELAASEHELQQCQSSRRAAVDATSTLVAELQETRSRSSALREELHSKRSPERSSNAPRQRISSPSPSSTKPRATSPATASSAPRAVPGGAAQSPHSRPKFVPLAGQLKSAQASSPKEATKATLGPEMRRAALADREAPSAVDGEHRRPTIADQYLSKEARALFEETDAQLRVNDVLLGAQDTEHRLLIEHLDELDDLFYKHDAERRDLVSEVCILQGELAETQSLQASPFTEARAQQDVEAEKMKATLASRVKDLHARTTSECGAAEVLELRQLLEERQQELQSKKEEQAVLSEKYDKQRQENQEQMNAQLEFEAALEDAPLRS
mmetsp:Transcript_68104/g.127179  ORF Transcript_68104/g.127179 Transcript_68104/m.127179 type:complete len:422 (+) Transcript_68104:58-1323(+)